MIIRTPDRTRYVVLAKTALEAPNLSFKAKGLWAYLMSKPDDWVVMVAQLVHVGPDRRTAIMSALRELEDAGLVVRQDRDRRDDGTWDLPTTEVYETPRSQPVSKTDSGRAHPSPGTTQELPGRSQCRLSTADNQHLLNHEVRNNESLISLGKIVELIADGRIEAKRRRGGPIDTPRAYRSTVVANARWEHGATIAALIAEHPDFTAQQIADEAEKDKSAVSTSACAADATDERPVSVTPEQESAAKKIQEAWIDTHPDAEGTPPWPYFLRTVREVAC